MNIFDREKANQIEGINVDTLKRILNNDTSSHEDLPSIDTIVFDSILLTDETKIKCVKNYYKLADGTCPKAGKSNNTCVAIQRFFNVTSRPYNCIECHRRMLNARKSCKVIPKL